MAEDEKTKQQKTEETQATSEQEEQTTEASEEQSSTTETESSTTESTEKVEDAEEDVKDAKDIKKRHKKDTESDAFDVTSWKPKTDLGKRVKAGDITNINQIFTEGKRILEPAIVDVLLPNIESDLLLIGQAKGKFGGGQRRIFRQTQKKTKEGNKPSFATFAAVGNRDGYVGIGYGKSRETVPAREKSIYQAKLNLIKIRRGSGSWEDESGASNSIPFAVEGKCGSSKIRLMPAPKGTGLCVEKECAKILSLAGIEDIWSTTTGQTKTKINLILACFDALKKLMKYNTRPMDEESNLIIEGAQVKDE
jgi:small subunit ribosomal protein S5